MASTNKTPKLGLNQWAAGDDVLRADFNADNAKLEEHVSTALDYMRVGTYMGDGAASRPFHLGFKPRLVIFPAQIGAPNSYVYFATEKFYVMLSPNAFQSSDISYGVYAFSEDGFVITDTTVLNAAGRTGCYFAFR